MESYKNASLFFWLFSSVMDPTSCPSYNSIQQILFIVTYNICRSFFFQYPNELLIKLNLPLYCHFYMRMQLWTKTLLIQRILSAVKRKQYYTHGDAYNIWHITKRISLDSEIDNLNLNTRITLRSNLFNNSIDHRRTKAIACTRLNNDEGYCWKVNIH